MSTARLDTVEHAVDVLAGLATPADRTVLDPLRERLATRRLRILVAGEAKRGKSTLVNRLLGREILPVGVTPVTAIVTTVRRRRDSTDEHAVVRYWDGRRARVKLDALADFVTERGNPNNTRQVGSVEVLLGAGPLDAYDVELVDTPGTGSVFEHNTEAAHDALESLDAAIFVVSADPPISAVERDLLQRVTELSVRTFVVLNKADQLGAAELREAREFTESVCASVTGRPMTAFTCSARAGSADAGYAHFARTFEQYLAANGGADLTAALRGHARRLAAGMLDAAIIAERGYQLAETAAADRVRLFRQRIDAIADRQHDLDDRCWATERGRLRSLGVSASQLIGELTASCERQARAALDGRLAALPPEQVEQQGRGLVIELIREAVDGWRAEAAQTLEAGLTAICNQATTELEAQLADVRVAARDLLDIALVARPRQALLRPSQRFWYAFDRPVSLEPPLAAAARRVLPGRARRARARTLADIPELVDRQVGRARADLHRRLHESVRSVLSQLHQEHRQTLQRIQTALADANAVHAATHEEQQRRSADLTSRVASLRSVLSRLEADAA